MHLYLHDHRASSCSHHRHYRPEQTQGLRTSSQSYSADHGPEPRRCYWSGDLLGQVWACSFCGQRFKRRDRFGTHHSKVHPCGARRCTHLTTAIIEQHHRAALGCGFCGEVVQPFTDRASLHVFVNHLIDHYNKKCTEADWSCTRHVQSMLIQEHVRPVWSDVCSSYFVSHSLTAWPTLVWTYGDARTFIDRLEHHIARAELLQILPQLLELGIAGSAGNIRDAETDLRAAAIAQTLALPLERSMSTMDSMFKPMLLGFGIDPKLYAESALSPSIQQGHDSDSLSYASTLVPSLPPTSLRGSTSSSTGWTPSEASRASSSFDMGSPAPSPYIGTAMSGPPAFGEAGTECECCSTGLSTNSLHGLGASYAADSGDVPCTSSPLGPGREADEVSPSLPLPPFNPTPPLPFARALRKPKSASILRMLQRK
ncbi:hypothetical protein LTR53_003885 [Teratosphaeriaceae sp. CCFEE 6253]|nr:hypothetical protein LTR53_003885 [Teratosphaeriaceae sp. CCFEE 6253]